MRGNGRRLCEKGWGLRFGQMGASMWDNGRIIKPTVREFFTTLMVMYMRESGSTTRQMVKELTLILMGPNMWESGKKTNKMVRGFRSGLTVRNTKDSTKMVLRPGKES